VTGAMTCSTALLSVAFVRRLAWLNSRIRADLLWQAAVPLCVPAWSTPKTNSASNICRIEALLSRVGVKDIMPIVAFMAPWRSLAMVGSCRYVELTAGRMWSYLTGAFRLALARTSVDATAFVGLPWAIALRLGVAVLVRSRRSVVKSSWRRTASKDILNPSKCL
jgi:hypothetical protein